MEIWRIGRSCEDRKMGRIERMEILEDFVRIFLKKKAALQIVCGAALLWDSNETYFFISFAQVSFRPIDLLNTGWSGVESLSTT